MDPRDFSKMYPVGDALTRGIRVPRSAFPVADALLARPQEITIYVRKGDHPKERTVAINPIPMGVDPSVLVFAGFAVDGNSATYPVDAYTWGEFEDGEGDRVTLNRFTPAGPWPGEWAATWSLTKAVNSVERALVRWLQRRGCTVKFG